MEGKGQLRVTPELQAGPHPPPGALQPWVLPSPPATPWTLAQRMLGKTRYREDGAWGRGLPRATKGLQLLGKFQLKWTKLPLGEWE